VGLLLDGGNRIDQCFHITLQVLPLALHGGLRGLGMACSCICTGGLLNEKFSLWVVILGVKNEKGSDRLFACIGASDEVNGSDHLACTHVSICAGFLLQRLWVADGVLVGTC